MLFYSRAELLYHLAFRQLRYFCADVHIVQAIELSTDPWTEGV
jgi:predicted transposase YdaD